METITTNKQMVQKTIFPILFTISFTHLLNDMLQAVIPSVYPLLKNEFHLTFTQIGLITFTYQLTASILQPFVGFYTDKKPKPFSLAIGMGFTLLGLIFLSMALSYATILLAVSLVGIGSSIFHPESSRVSHLASGGKRGLAQSIFQLGGNAGSAIGPLLAAIIVIPYGQSNIIWFGLVAIAGILILSKIGFWYRKQLNLRAVGKQSAEEVKPMLSKNRVVFSLIILLLLIFSKYFYMASMTSYYTFYLIDKFHLSVQQSQVYLFIFLAAVAAGTLAGGPLGDRFGRKYIIWISILGVAPFTLALPYLNLFWTAAFSIMIGLIIASAFSAILVYAQELVPGKVGMISGLFFGLAFGMGGLGSAVLGKLVDQTSINYVFHLCAFLPLIGIITGFLPNIESRKK
ncbi:MFS transporter, FSR family, fosmidomycin resistance protein [Pseudarcicella hirudinis]|uniref:MFS transporter, FSR family, fosmidomycin resistance protein n=1 Tax=Pseudarcicella hirudinis TaxID=1079859 RepID=A0A1I5M2V5_9BACT|nr:MFS transporter [Pseudarcicella hirudinis]SFP03830.1 MFS transporter, FSR family, fosmidomycin resistance protein [Pseudarcicella hirudinis]